MKVKNTVPKIGMNQLITFIFVLLVAGIAAMVGLNINNSVGDTLATCATGFEFDGSIDLCVNSTNSSQTHDRVVASNLEYNASRDSATGISNLTDQFPNIGLVIGAVVIITILVGGFAFAFRGRGGF